VVRYSKVEAAQWSSEEARMKVLLAFLLAATEVAWAVAQVASFTAGGGSNVSGAPLTVITESMHTRQGR
jgi:hypothetical protein